MTPQEIIKKLNDIQQLVYGIGLTNADRNEWAKYRDMLNSMGYIIKKKRVNGMAFWYYVSREELTNRRNNRFLCEFVEKDMSPSHKHLKGNCTTRAMVYALNGLMSYEEIEAEQYRLADIHGHRRNTNGVWDRVLTNRGWTRIRLFRTLRRDKLAILFKGYSEPIVSVSSGHCAIVHNGSVVDKWDSRGGKVKIIIVKSDDIKLFLDRLSYCDAEVM